MGLIKNSIAVMKGKHLTREDRIRIEILLNRRTPTSEIAELLGRHQRTIEREIKRGTVEHLDSQLRNIMSYSCETGQRLHDFQATAKGVDLKIDIDKSLAQYIQNGIKKKYSPAVIANQMKKEYRLVQVCTKTIYSYIDQGFIPEVTNNNLWEKKYRKQRHPRKVRTMKGRNRGTSIEQRPSFIEKREEFGHWEMDTVVGGARSSSRALLVLSERKNRYELIFPIKDKTQKSVLGILNKLERQYGSRSFRNIFKSITVDNGSEFLDYKSMEKSNFTKKLRTKIFYAHSYCAWERGTNENINKMIRRFVNKGTDIKSYSHQHIKEIQDWINAYPRKILGYASAEEVFNQDLIAS